MMLATIAGGGGILTLGTAWLAGKKKGKGDPGDGGMSAAEMNVAGAIILFGLGYLFYFVLPPLPGYLLGVRSSSLCLLVLYGFGAAGVFRAAWLAWLASGHEKWPVRIGSLLLCSVTLAGVFLIFDSIHQMHGDQCGIYSPVPRHK